MKTLWHKLAFIRNSFALIQDTLDFFQRAGAQDDICNLQLSPFRNIYLVNSPDLMKEVMVTKSSSFRKGRAIQIVKSVIGDGIVSSGGERHRRQRTMMQPFFRPHQIAAYSTTMVDCTLDLMEQWNDGEERMITDDMSELTLAIITQSMFGVHMYDEVKQILHAIDISFQHLALKTKLRIQSSAYEMIPTKQNRNFQEAVRMLNSTLNAIIEERRQNPVQRNDLLARLIEARDEEDGSGMSNEDIIAQVMTIFVAGHETISNTLSWTWYLLAKHPQAAERFLEEIDSVLQGRLPQTEDVSKLPYVNAVVLESMRLFPAVWSIGREAIQDVEIGGRLYKKGDSFVLSQYVSHRNPKYFEHPDDFIPERFLGELLKTLPPFAYFPFGGGPRICIGNTFAMNESILILATIGQRFQLQLADDHHEVIPEVLLSLRPKHGLRMRVTRRDIIEETEKSGVIQALL